MHVARAAPARGTMIVLSVITASGRSKRSFRSKCTWSGSAGSVRPGAQWCGRNQTESIVGGAIGPPVSAAATSSSQKSGLPFSTDAQRRPDVAALDRELARLLVLHDVDERGRRRRAGRSPLPRSCHHSCVAQRGDLVGAIARPRSSSASVSVTVGRAHRPGPVARSMPASVRPTWRNVAVLRVLARRRTRRGPRTAGRRRARARSWTGRDAGVGAGASSATHSSRSRRRERGPEVGADLVLHVVVGLVVDPLLAGRARGRGWPRSAARSRRPTATCRRRHA